MEARWRVRSIPFGMSEREGYKKAILMCHTSDASKEAKKDEVGIGRPRMGARAAGVTCGSKRWAGHSACMGRGARVNVAGGAKLGSQMSTLAGRGGSSESVSV